MTLPISHRPAPASRSSSDGPEPGTRNAFVARLPEMERRIYGLENEYGVTCTLRGQRRLSPDEVAPLSVPPRRVMGSQLERLPRERCPLLPGRRPHPEYATPECDSPRQLIVYDKAGERILEDLADYAEEKISRGADSRQDLRSSRTTPTSSGNSYGCHENYLTTATSTSTTYAEQLIPFLVTRQIYTGAGKVFQTAGRSALLRRSTRRSTSTRRSRAPRRTTARSSTLETSPTPTARSTDGST